MNYNKEQFPANIADLIEQCEEVVSKIQICFAKPDSLTVKDLYQINKGHKQKDFISKFRFLAIQN
ncbi:MAG: hypothetical protein EOO43_11815 [Flavobacterium sp.]|nr:MAG: hypothetical protein EOO43_11815 [Flavobacterium sp.]